MLNYDFIVKKARDSKIDNITIEREYWQLLILQRLFTVKAAKNLFFKGGTAIRFLLGSFRFSEDLDFTATLKIAVLKKLLLDMFDYFMKNTASNLEFKEEKIPATFQDVSIRYRFLFKPRITQQKTSIRIDISLREKPLTREHLVLTPFDYPISPYPLVVHLSYEEIMAEKIRALFIRGKPRDLFDLWFLLSKKIRLREDLIKKKFKLYPKLSYSKKKLKDTILSFDRQELKRDLNQFLPENYRFFYKTLPEETFRLLEGKK